jgi:hypothetical protein
MENFLNQNHYDLSQEELPQREKRLRKQKNVLNENSCGSLFCDFMETDLPLG